MRERICQELALLRRHYGNDVQYRESGDWFLLPRYPAPAPCAPNPTQISFALRPGYPGAEPYGFFVSEDLRFNGQKFNSVAPSGMPPFPGQWIFFSWAPDGWLATADPTTGSNLWAWARTFVARLREGP
jgi:hypothetical protein